MFFNCVCVCDPSVSAFYIGDVIQVNEYSRRRTVITLSKRRDDRRPSLPSDSWKSSDEPLQKHSGN